MVIITIFIWLAKLRSQLDIIQFDTFLNLRQLTFIFGYYQIVHPPPPSSIHLHSAPSTSTQLILTSTQLHPPTPSSFQPPPSSLQHPQQYLDQNIARNCIISLNLGRKIKNYPFWLKIATYGILEMLILKPDLDFWNSDAKSHFWANLGPKIQSCLFSLKIGAHSIPRMMILNPDQKFWPQNPFLGKFGPKHSKLSVSSESWCMRYLKDADSKWKLRFLKFWP